MIALFGGTFDPIHLGHVAAAEAAKGLLGVSEVRLLVASKPYHKTDQGQQVTSAQHRFAMTQIACANLEAVLADGSELGRDRPSFTVELLERRREEDPRERRVWVIGSDAFSELTTWHRWQELFGLTNFLVLQRSGHPLKLPRALAECVRSRQVSRVDRRRHEQVLFSSMELPEVSSSEIRERLRRGQPCEHLLPRGVSTYIRQNNLYTECRAACPT